MKRIKLTDDQSDTYRRTYSAALAEVGGRVTVHDSLGCSLEDLHAVTPQHIYRAHELGLAAIGEAMPVTFDEFVQDCRDMGNPDTDRWLAEHGL